jgi:hypothetical protein
MATLCAALPGCQIWNAWLDALKWKPAIKPASAGPLATQSLTASAASSGTPAANSALFPRITLYRITVPVGTFSANDKIWAQLNEDAINSSTAVLMAQNGLRAATGDVARWPTIAKMLETPGASNDQVLLQTDGRSSINVVTRQNVTDQIVVSVDHDHQLQGRTFERCDNGFRLAMRGVRNKPQLEVQLEPIVTLGTIQIARPGMGITSTGISSEESFEDLRMATTLTADQFLVVSAMDPKTSAFSVGTLWLSDHDRVPATETVLVFVPTPGAK